jgi:hypothetical protein
MLGNCTKYLFVLFLLVAMIAAAQAASADNLLANYDPCTGAQLDCAPGIKPISKVKPLPEPNPIVPTTPNMPYKVKSSGALAPSYDGLNQLNPANWLADCCLPMPAKGQFWIGPKVTFARVAGEVRRGPDLAVTQTSLVAFEDHLSLRRSGNAIWSLEAMYQLRPRWGLRYSFMPINLEAVGTAKTAFNFGGQTFASGTQLSSKWDRVQHRAGFFFNVNRTLSSQTSLFADWLYVQDKLTVGGASGIGTSVTWDDTKNLAIVGLEFDKCLKNYHGNTLAFNGKGGVAFFSDTVGYEAEAALSYLIPIKTGRFGFIKGGYSYANLKKEKSHDLFSTVIDGPFVQVGFLF